MKAAVFDKFGDPAEVLQVRDVPMPEPGPGEVRVRMIASPINPSDLLTVHGRYGKPPRLPATPGFEGTGIVEKNGGGLFGRWVLGKRVAVINARGGNWQQFVVIPAKQAVRVPEGIPDEQAACFFVNPASALVMTRMLRIPRGEWLLQTAAGSALGRMIIRLGKRNRFRTINVVRRKETAEELLKLAQSMLRVPKRCGDYVLNTSEESLEERVRSLTGGKGVRFAIDAVGGETGVAVVRALAPGGRMLVYGTLADEPMSIHPRVLIAGGKRVEGFWLAEWMRRQNPVRLLMLFRQIGRLMREGVLVSDIGQTYPLDQVAEAARMAAEPGRKGKVLLRMDQK